MQLSQTGVLTLQSVTLADAGVYLCVGAVPSVPGLRKQANVTLTIKGTKCKHRHTQLYSSLSVQSVNTSCHQYQSSLLSRDRTKLWAVNKLSTLVVIPAAFRSVDIMFGYR